MYAFKDSNLSGSITLPASLEEIQYQAFYNCSSLTSVSFESDSSLNTIGNNVFQSSGLTTITLPANLTSLGNDVFNGCSSLTIIEAYQNIINDKSWSTSPQIIDNESITIINLSPHTLFTYNNNTTSTTVVTVIASSNDNSTLQTINIGALVTSIGDNAFKELSGLTDVSFVLLDSQLATIGEKAFYNSGISGGITLPASVTSIGDQVFYYCNNLTSVSFDANSQLNTIGQYAFANSGLSGNITLPVSVTSIGQGAFNDCSSSFSINFSSLSNLVTIGNNAFDDSGLNGALLYQSQ